MKINQDVLKDNTKKMLTEKIRCLRKKQEVLESILDGVKKGIIPILFYEKNNVFFLKDVIKIYLASDNEREFNENFQIFFGENDEIRKMFNRE